MGQTRIRPTTKADKTLAREIHHAAYRDVIVRQFGGWDEALQDSFFESGWSAGPHEAIEVDGQVVGFFRRTINPDHILLVEISLKPNSQRLGLGTEIIKEQIAEARALGIPVKLRVLKENFARALYERLGFEVSSQDATHYTMTCD